MLAPIALGAHARAGIVPDYGLSWSTVTHAGNRPANAAEAPDFYRPTLPSPILAGSVGYEYRISTTEVTTAQWAEFVRAYAPFYAGPYNDAGFTSVWINYVGNGQFNVPAGTEQWPASVSWRMAARYCNWLHNGKVNQASAFESGAYDTSTFAPASPGSPFDNDQRTRSPGASFWIPSGDEWIKAAYYDPDRYGPGLDGYWRRPGRSDAPLRPGLPADGGQTSGGLTYFLGLPVGMYPGVTSPWGLLDVSGGVSEWTETAEIPFNPTIRNVVGSSSGDGTTYLDNLNAYPGSDGGLGSLYGLRLASTVPTPTSALSITVLGLALTQRRRR